MRRTSRCIWAAWARAVRALIERHGAKFRPGDAWLLNSPYAGSTHLPDITVIMPASLPRRAG